jgi:O-antigen ligase
MVQKLLITFLLFILPLIVFPFGISYFETPKILLAEVAIEILLISGILASNSILRINKYVFIPLGAIIGLSILHLIIFSSSLTLLGNMFRLQGVFLLWHFVIFSLISSQIKISFNKFIPLASLCILTVETFIFGPNINGRYISALGEPNAFAATLVFLLPLLLKGKGKWAQILFFIIVTVLIGLTGSRSGLIALGIESLFLFGVRIMNFPLKKAVFFAILVAFLSCLLPFVQYNDSYENRAQIWLTAVNSALQSPLIGHGFGNIETALKETSHKSETTIQYAYVDSTHNLFLDWSVEGGLIGVSALVILIGFALFNLIKHKKIIYLASFIGLVTCLLFNPGSIVTLVAFWWLMGQGYE